MPRPFGLFLFLLPFIAVRDLGAASASAPSLPSISIQLVEPGDLVAYVRDVGAVNAAMKAGHGVPLFLRVYAGEAVGEGGPTFFALSPADSFATLQQNTEAFFDDTALAELRARVSAVGQPASRTLLKAVRFDGTHAPGWLFNTQALVTDEAAFLASIAGLRVLLDDHAMDDARINVFRIVAGRSTWSHLVSINTPSSARLAVVLDALAATPGAVAWTAQSNQFQSIVRTGTFREIGL